MEDYPDCPPWTPSLRLHRRHFPRLPSPLRQRAPSSIMYGALCSSLCSTHSYCCGKGKWIDGAVISLAQTGKGDVVSWPHQSYLRSAAFGDENRHSAGVVPLVGYNGNPSPP